MASDLLAVAGDEEERVVDGEPESEPDHEVEGEDAQVVGLVDGGEGQERAQDGGGSHEERHPGGATSEEQDREHDQDGQGVGLGPSEILTDGGPELEVGDRGPTGGNVGDSGSDREQVLRPRCERGRVEQGQRSRRTQLRPRQ